jgi:hypothetical protein
VSAQGDIGNHMARGWGKLAFSKQGEKVDTTIQSTSLKDSIKTKWALLFLEEFI